MTLPNSATFLCRIGGNPLHPDWLPLVPPYAFLSRAKLAISFLVPTLSKAISNRVSFPMGVAPTTMPVPKVLWDTRSPGWKEAEGLPAAPTPVPNLMGRRGRDLPVQQFFIGLFGPFLHRLARAQHV